MTRILYDAFHHMMPGHRIGENIIVGGYAVNFGRYSPGDCHHPNGLTYLHADLAPDFELRLLNEPYSDRSLSEADILLVTNPDYPLYEGVSPHRWTPQDVDALMRFMERGGGLLLMVNSFLSRPDYWEENFDYERVSLLFDRLGVRWDPNYMSDDKMIERAAAGNYRIGYGQGGRVLGKLPKGMKPLITYKDFVYGFEGPVGRGHLAVIGDTGTLSNGLMCFPGFDNAAFFNALIRRLRPAWSRAGARRWDFKRYGHISNAPSRTGLNEDMVRRLRPAAAWMEDHHYRHLAWDAESAAALDARVWERLPIKLAALKTSGALKARLNLVALDTDRPGAPCTIPLTVARTQSPGGTDLHVIGRTKFTGLSLSDICANPELLAAIGKLEFVHTAFEMRAVLDERGRGKSARWSQSQIVYARSPRAGHYGYEILLHSTNGIILPRA
jgi:hypothetical protein